MASNACVTFGETSQEGECCSDYALCFACALFACVEWVPLSKVALLSHFGIDCQRMLRIYVIVFVEMQAVFVILGDFALPC